MTAAQIATYRFADRDVRTIVEDDTVLIAADVASILGYRMASDLTRTLEDDERGTRLVRTPSGEQVVSVITEAGLFRAIIQRQSSRITDESVRSRVKDFQRWVTHDLLPAVNRGEVAVQSSQFQIPTSFAEALELAARQQRSLDAAEQKIQLDAPKVEAFDALMDADGYYDMLAAAKLLGVGRTTLFRRLRDVGVLIPASKMPYQRYMHHFKITTSTWTGPDGDTHTTHTTRVRPSGLDFLRKKLADTSSESLRVLEGGQR